MSGAVPADGVRLHRLLGGGDLAALRRRLRARFERGATGDEFERLCGNEPTSSIMSKIQMKSGSVFPVSFSSLTAPSFEPSWKPSRSAAITWPRFDTK